MTDDRNTKTAAEARKLPLRMKLVDDGPERWIVINDNSHEEHASVWRTPKEAVAAAWDWWHDVKGNHDE